MSVGLCSKVSRDMYYLFRISVQGIIIWCVSCRRHFVQLRIFMGWCQWWKRLPNHRWWPSTMQSWPRYSGSRTVTFITPMLGTNFTICRKATTRTSQQKIYSWWLHPCYWQPLQLHLMIASMVLTILNLRWRKTGISGWPIFWGSLLTQRRTLGKL